MLTVQDILKKIKQIGLMQKKNFEKRLSFIKGDIRDFELLDSIFANGIKNQQPIECVIHLAGLKAVEESVKNPLLYWDNNLIGSLVLFKAMKKNDCKNIVFSSSATLYGDISNKLISEEEKIKPCNTYGKTKLAIEEVLREIHISSGKSWRIINLRYFNPIVHKSVL